jgi:hypothetical protein
MDRGVAEMAASKGRMRERAGRDREERLSG